MILTNETINNNNNNNLINTFNINTISNNNTLEQSIEGLSTIQKDEQNDTELEEYINKCLNTISLKKKKNKSILKSSKSNISKMKKEILAIFKDNSELIKYFSLIQERNDKDLQNSILNANKIFEDEIDELYKWKLNEINKINKDFNDDLFEMKDLSEEENRFKLSNNHNNIFSDKSDITILYNEIKNDKEKELEKLEKEFNKKKKIIINKFKEVNEQNDDFSLNDRSIIYKNEIFETIKDKIKEIINPNEKKKVCMKLERNEVYE